MAPCRCRPWRTTRPVPALKLGTARSQGSLAPPRHTSALGVIWPSSTSPTPLHPTPASPRYAEPSSERSHCLPAVAKTSLPPRTQLSLQASQVLTTSPSHTSGHRTCRWVLSFPPLTAVLKPLSLPPPRHPQRQSSCLQISPLGSPLCFSHPDF